MNEQEFTLEHEILNEQELTTLSHILAGYLIEYTTEEATEEAIEKVLEIISETKGDWKISYETRN